uniref:Glucanase inhibitor protein n=1 Tax=Phytophthora cinnamomi TaxID=4785 RepID=B0B0H5_PHYCI|nr:glucanase inhibitor protein [Phytophthora cinnamomi]
MFTSGRAKRSIQWAFVNRSLLYLTSTSSSNGYPPLRNLPRTAHSISPSSANHDGCLHRRHCTHCGGALISPTHVLTTASCTAYEEGSSIPHWAAVGTHYINGAKDGERIKIVSTKNHTLYNSSSFSYNFAVLTLENPSKFAPVKLPKADGSDIFPRGGRRLCRWGDTSYPNGKPSDELQSVDLRVWGDNACENKFLVDKSSLCAGGDAGKDSCIGDTGDPLIKENGRGDADDIVIGLSGWGAGCGDKGIPAVYSRVSAGIEWINSIIKA